MTGDDITTAKGYLLDGKRLTIFQAPGATITLSRNINDRGQVVGYGLASLTDAPTGFLRSDNGQISLISRPGAAFTAAFGINNRGQIAGVGPSPAYLAAHPEPAMGS